MSRFLFILAIAFVVVFVVKQSHLFQQKKVYDASLGVYKDEYHTNWENLKDYLNDLPDKAKSLLPQRR